VSIYLDASVIASSFAADTFSPRALAFLGASRSNLIVSDFGSAEFISAIGRLTRTGELTRGDANRAIANFDTWRGLSTFPASVQASDVADAERFLRRLDLVLRTPDAVHIAIALRLGAELATFDTRMAECARALGAAAAVL
jgi:predicted nucleic acid-binding protein